MKARSLVLLLAFLAGNMGAVEAKFASLTVTNLDGVKLDLPLRGEAKATVLVFLTQDCPIANAYAPEISRLRADYVAKHVMFVLVQVDPQLTPAAARQHAQAFSHTGPIVLDHDHAVVQHAGATITPQAVLVQPDGLIVYRGRIDDLFADYGKRRAAATQHDLRVALDAVLANQPVLNTETKAIGCFIPDLKLAK